MLIVKSIENNTMYSMQELHLFLCFFDQLFLLYQYFQCNLQLIYQLIFFYIYSFHSLNTHQRHKIYRIYTHFRFQIDPLSHTPLLINSLHSHLHLSSFQRCLLLETLAGSLHLHLPVSCHSDCFVLLVLGIRLNTLTFKFFAISGTHNVAYRLIDVVETTTAFTYFNTKRKRHSFFPININNLWSYFALLIVH